MKSDHNSNQILFTELTLEHNSLEINDDHMRYANDATRKMEFLNVEKVRIFEDLKSNFDLSANTQKREIIKMFLLTMGNHNLEHERFVTTYWELAALVGGLSQSIIAILACVNLLFGKPY